MNQNTDIVKAFERSIKIPSPKLPVVEADPWQKMREANANANEEANASDPNVKSEPPEIKSEPLAVNVLAEACDLSKGQIKQVMQNGAVWLRRRNKKVLRVRRAKTALRPGDEISIFYDPYVQKQQAEAPILVADEGPYTVWNKPAGMLSQGSKYGDHCAITRWVEKNSETSRQVYLVHRLDRAASGVMLLAHNSKLAAELSKLFQSREIEKTYKVTVHGQFEKELPFKMDQPLDGKTARSNVIEAKVKNDQSELVVQIETGRKHQIRRHLADIGFPVVGDHLHGRDEDQALPMLLKAAELKFVSPVSGKEVTYQAR